MPREEGLRVVVDYDRSSKNALFSIVWDYKGKETELWNAQSPLDLDNEESLSQAYHKGVELVKHCKNKYPDRNANLVVTPTLFKQLPAHLISDDLMLSTDFLTANMARKSLSVKPYVSKDYRKAAREAWRSRAEEMYVNKQASNAIARIEVVGLDDSLAAYLSVSVDSVPVKRVRISDFYHVDSMKKLVDKTLERVPHMERFREVHVPNLNEFISKYTYDNVKVDVSSECSTLPYDLSIPLKSGFDKHVVVAETPNVFASRYISGSLAYNTASGDVVAHVREEHAYSNSRTATLLSMVEQVERLSKNGVSKGDIVLVAKDRLMNFALRLLTCYMKRSDENDEIYESLLDFKAKNKEQQIFKDALVAYCQNYPESLRSRSTLSAYQHLKGMRTTLRGGDIQVVNRKGFKDYTSDAEMPFHHCKSLCAMHVSKLRHLENIGLELTSKDNGENVPNFIDSLKQSVDKASVSQDNSFEKTRFNTPRM
ncbi:hypothetical protein [Vibrio sp. D431a]|uniref:hypothetical protein n=1 Tax=Vibrio sp. D431a TaxID=2837388 RepID=UPI002554F6B3|nr:hypothetical protein [Vibrio sp. D431a]MDK9790641.1 hypothetical protein [Vibrio sp. D431a]